MLRITAAAADASAWRGAASAHRQGSLPTPWAGLLRSGSREATGLLEGDLHIERGIRIALPSGGSIFAYGEPNSLDWPSPVDGIRWAVANYPKCSTNGTQPPARRGTLAGAGRGCRAASRSSGCSSH